jgi:hypothetical protein
MRKKAHNMRQAAKRAREQANCARRDEMVRAVYYLKHGQYPPKEREGN